MVTLLRGTKICVDDNTVVIEYKKAVYEFIYKDDMMTDLLSIGLDRHSASIINNRIQKKARDRALIGE